MTAPLAIKSLNAFTAMHPRTVRNVTDAKQHPTGTSPCRTGDKDTNRGECMPNRDGRGPVGGGGRKSGRKKGNC